MKQFTKEAAILIAETGAWKNWTSLELAYVQIHQERLLCPFDKFHEALEKELSQSIFTHQFADKEFVEYCKKELHDKVGWTTILARTVNGLEFNGYTDITWFEEI